MLTELNGLDGAVLDVNDAVTHNAMIAPLGNRVIHVKNGAIESVELCEHPARVEDIAW